MKKLKRYVPKNTEIYAWIDKDYRDNPCCGDTYKFDKIIIIVNNIEKDNVIFYKNGIKKIIPKNDFRHMIVSIPGKYQFSAHPNN